jgi:hypothetical protein
MLPTYVLAHHLPAPAAPPTLSVNAKGRVYPSKALLVKLQLRIGQLIDLLPPTDECPNWQLDVRPQTGRRIMWYENTMPRIEGVRLPPGLLAPGTRLILALVSAEPISPGRYALLARAA